MEKLLQDLLMAIMLGTISSSSFESLKQNNLINFTGNKLTFISLLYSILFGFFVGYVYLGYDMYSMILISIWTIIGGQSVYAAVQKIVKK